jgi:hypothetical protein
LGQNGGREEKEFYDGHNARAMALELVRGNGQYRNTNIHGSERINHKLGVENNP